MDRAEIDRLVQRLVENPHDEEALAYAHQAGEADPKSYAMFLERVGTETADRAYAAHDLPRVAPGGPIPVWFDGSGQGVRLVQRSHDAWPRPLKPIAL